MESPYYCVFLCWINLSFPWICKLPLILTVFFFFEKKQGLCLSGLNVLNPRYQTQNKPQEQPLTEDGKVKCLGSHITADSWFPLRQQEIRAKLFKNGRKGKPGRRMVKKEDQGASWHMEHELADGIELVPWVLWYSRQLLLVKHFYPHILNNFFFFFFPILRWDTVGLLRNLNTLNRECLKCKVWPRLLPGTHQIMQVSKTTNIHGKMLENPRCWGRLKNGIRRTSCAGKPGWSL